MNKHTILFLAANPSGTDRLALDREARAIKKELEGAGFRDSFNFETRWAVEPLDLLRELRKLKPAVVHFSGHGGQSAASQYSRDRAAQRERPGEHDVDDGEQQRGMFLHGSDGGSQLVSVQAIEQAFGAAGSSVKLVVLNACYSEVQADALLAHVDCVVGMSGAIHDDAARSFAIGFYGGLGECESVAAAYMQGRAAISLQGLRDSDRPQLRVRAGVDASQLVFAAARQASSRGPAVARLASRSSNRTILRDLDPGRMFLVRRQPWGRVGLAIAATTLAGAAASIAATWPRSTGANATATGDAPASAVEVADTSGGPELEARRQPPGMRWLHAADVQLGTPPVELQRLRERCKAIAGGKLCEHLERTGYWSREAPRRMHVEGFFLDVREVTASAFAEWLTSRRDARVRGKWIEIDGARVARTHKLILYDEDAAGRFRVRDGYAAYPMVGVTWDGARRMCAWRGARLPSGTQWERAARGAWGAIPALDEGPRFCTDVLIAGCVGAASIQPSGYGVRDNTSEGIADLLGSVSEWTSDPDERPGVYEIRGGSFSLPWLLARPASRLFLDEADDDVGFRCAAAPHGATG